MKIKDNISKSDRTLSNKGYTLVELIIYLAISTIVILLSMNLIKAITQSYAHEKGISEVQSSGRDVTAIMARDIVNAGFKTFLANGTTLTTVARVKGNNTYTGADNNASIFYVNNGNLDQLAFKMIVISAAPTTLTELDSIVYSVTSDNMLIRRKFVMTAANAIIVPPATLPTMPSTPNQIDTLASSGIECMRFEFSTDNTTWATAPVVGTISSIKAIRLFVILRTNQQSLETKGVASYSLDNANGLVYTCPTGDKYIRRQYTETIEVENNGL